MNRLLIPGGINAFSTWEAVGWFAYVGEALARIPGAPPFPNNEEIFRIMQRGNRWDDKDWIREKALEYYAQVDVYSLPKVHRISAEEFIDTFGGPMVLEMLSLFWGEENKEKYGHQLAGCLRDLLTDKRMEYVNLQMDAIITVAKKAF